LINAGGTGEDHGFAAALDSEGNKFVAGNFKGTATFGDTSLTTVGTWGIFLAKYDLYGGLLWIQHGRLSGVIESFALSIAIDDWDNVLITGGYKGGTLTFESTTLPPGASQSSAFVAKFSSTGSLQWLIPIHENNNSTAEGAGIACDSQGNCLVVGGFGHHSSGGTATFESTILTSYGGRDIFLAKYDPDGNLLWVRQAGGSANGGTHRQRDNGDGIAVGLENEVTITGRYRSTTTVGDTTLYCAGDSDVFLATYSENGIFLRAASAGGLGWDIGLDLYCDFEGEITLAGRFELTAEFNPYLLMSAGDADIFVTRYTQNLDPVWATSAGGLSYDWANGITSYGGIASTGCDQLLITGTFYDEAQFGDITLYGSSNGDAFLARLDNSGVFQWAEASANTGVGAAGSDIAADAIGNTAASGYFYGELSFLGHTVVSSGHEDIFLGAMEVPESEPAAIELEITTVGEDAVLTWAAVEHNSFGCPIAVDRYLIYFSENAYGPYWFHGYTTGLEYIHAGVVTHAEMMFYQVTAYIGSVALLDEVLDSGERIRMDVLQSRIAGLSD